MSDATTGLPESISLEDLPVPVRIGAWVERGDGALVGHVRMHPALVHHDMIEPTALVNIVDMLGGLSADDDPDQWVFTSSLSLRMSPVPAPDGVTCTVRQLRSGPRSSTSEIHIASSAGAPLGLGLAALSRVPRRPTDPPKPDFDLEVMSERWSLIPPLDVPPREAAGVRVVDRATGRLELDVRPAVCNPSGATHGAMLGMLIAASAEEAAAAHAGEGQDAGAFVAADLDIRYLSQARHGPVVATARFIGDPSLGSLVVDVVDRGRDDHLVAIATVRTYPASAIGVL